MPKHQTKGKTDHISAEDGVFPCAGHTNSERSSQSLYRDGGRQLEGTTDVETHCSLKDNGTMVTRSWKLWHSVERSQSIEEEAKKVRRQ